MKVLLTGGAGYVGSLTAHALSRAGHHIVVLDNLQQGHRRAVGDLPLVTADLTDRDALLQILAEGRFDAVCHFAALISAGESVSRPDLYYRTNVTGSLNLLEAMIEAGTRRLVFSSSAAVYGSPGRVPIPEEHPVRPVNPYGETKAAVERAIGWYAAAGLVGAVCLRYFNAAGASDDASLGEDHRPETHLVPLVLQVALGRRDAVEVFGTDYDTPDGTCIRDFVHVEDLAAAHVRALEAVEPGRVLVYNVGTGRGHSVREVIDTARRVTGKPVPVVEAPRRPGDAPVLVAAAERIGNELGWQPRYTDLDDIIASAWAWHRRHPTGYEE